MRLSCVCLLVMLCALGAMAVRSKVDHDTSILTEVDGEWPNLKDLKNKANDLKNKVVDKASDLKGKVVDKASDLKAKADQTAADLKAKADKAAADLKAKAEKTAASLKTAAGKVADAAFDTYGFVKDGMDSLLSSQKETPFTPGTLENDPMLIGADEDLFCAQLSSAIYKLDPSVNSGKANNGHPPVPSCIIVPTPSPLPLPLALIRQCADISLSYKGECTAATIVKKYVHMQQTSWLVHIHDLQALALVFRGTGA
jgi:hypothetical protein